MPAAGVDRSRRRLRPNDRITGVSGGIACLNQLDAAPDKGNWIYSLAANGPHIKGLVYTRARRGAASSFSSVTVGYQGATKTSRSTLADTASRQAQGRLRRSQRFFEQCRHRRYLRLAAEV
jgi:hypothetical protein